MVDKVKRLANKYKYFYYITNLLFLLSGYLFSLLCLCMRIFPIQENKILCSNMKGKRYGDNPMYIADELQQRNKQHEIVWLLQKNITDDIPHNIRRASTNIFSMAYELATAKVWIDSNTKPYGTLKRKGQLYVQTWHGSYGLKKIGRDLEEKLGFIDNILYPYNSRIIDLFLSNSKKTSEIYRRAFWYDGEILECGSPRNDVFFKDTSTCLKKVQSYFHTQGKKMALYAPTYRKNSSTQAFRLDYTRLKMTLEKRFGGEWIILVRLHPHNIMEADAFISYNDYVLNATYYNVMQELLVACDILITDYSSCMFDFVTKYKTCFLYATDVGDYIKERDNYFKLEELPFPFAFNNQQLEQAILQFNWKSYKKGLDKLFEKVGLCERGSASIEVADYIEQWIIDNR